MLQLVFNLKKNKEFFLVCVCGGVFFSCQTVCMLAHYLWQRWCWYNLSPWKGPIIPDYKSYQESRLDIWVIQLNPLHSSWTLLKFMSSRVSGSDPIGSSEFKLILSDHIHLKCSMHFHHLPTKFFFKTYSEFLLSIRASHYNAREVQPHFCWVQIQNKNSFVAHHNVM